MSRLNLAHMIYRYWTGQGQGVSYDDLRDAFKQMELNVESRMNVLEKLYHKVCLRAIEHYGRNDYARNFKRLARRAAKRAVGI